MGKILCVCVVVLVLTKAHVILSFFNSEFHDENSGLPQYSNTTQLEDLSQWLGFDFPVAVVFTGMGYELMDPLFEVSLANLWNHRKIPLVTWMPVRGDITWNNRSTIEISSGEEDYYLGLFIAKLRAFVSGSDTILGTGDDRRVYLRLAHEMNGGWYTYSQGENTPEEYIKMWRYIFALVRAAELTQDHVSFMWCVHTYDGVPGAPAEAWYPGDEFVDWVGIDGYNFDTSNYGTFWQSPYDVFFSMLDRMKLYKKPIAIPEFGTVPRFIDDPTHRCFNRLGLEQKSEWLRQALEMIHENSVIRMISYFNINKRDGGTPLGQAWGIFTSSLQNASDCEQLCYCASGTSRFTARSGITYETFPVFREELRAMKPFLILGSQQNPRILDSRVFQGKNPKRPSIKRTDF